MFSQCMLGSLWDCWVNWSHVAGWVCVCEMKYENDLRNILSFLEINSYFLGCQKRLNIQFKTDSLKQTVSRAGESLVTGKSGMETEKHRVLNQSSLSSRCETLFLLFLFLFCFSV